MTKHEQAVIDTAIAMARAKGNWIGQCQPPSEPLSYIDHARRSLAISNAAHHLVESEMEHAYAVRDLLAERGDK